MPPLPTGEPVWNLQFNENGQLTSPDQGSFLAEVAASGVTDLFAFSHGWGTSQDSASRLYGQIPSTGSTPPASSTTPQVNRSPGHTPISGSPR